VGDGIVTAVCIALQYQYNECNSLSETRRVVTTHRKIFHPDAVPFPRVRAGVAHGNRGSDARHRRGMEIRDGIRDGTPLQAP
jgi:hypothetical protein